MYLRGKRLHKKVFLGTLLLAQLSLIGIFLLFGSIYTERSASDTEFSVQFVQIEGDEKFNKNQVNEKTAAASVQRRRINTTGVSYRDEFFQLSQINDNNIRDDILCFRDGSRRNVDNRTLLGNASSDGCQCQSEYHGKDCGQPEVLWRAFMTSRAPLVLAGPRTTAHRVFYQINAISDATIETIEMQIMELVHVVDLFIFCQRTTLPDDVNDRSRDGGNHFIRNHIETGLLKKYIFKILILDIKQCTPKATYRKFRESVAATDVTGTDILLYSNIDEILNWRAIKYFKWYDNWPQPVKFRLKYTVYGYFWQHPENTRLGSAACQLNVLDEMYKGDPERMIQTHKPGMIVGDLNHFGGWYCQYCYHPVNIIKQLLIDGRQDVFENRKKSIDSVYIENLISNGLYVDGKLGLHRLHRFVDKYYAPDHVLDASWKFESLLTNIYANYDDDYDVGGNER